MQRVKRPFPLTLFLGLACTGPAEDVEGPTAAEYAVYSDVIREVVLTEGWGGPLGGQQVPIGLIVIRGLTIDSSSIDGVATVSAHHMPGLTEATVADFREKNNTPHWLERRFDGIGDYVLLPPDSLELIFEPGRWPAFYERFPDAPGYIDLSRVGFAPDTSHAIVQVDQLRYPEWGRGTVYLMEREDGAWHVRDQYVVWEA